MTSPVRRLLVYVRRLLREGSTRRSRTLLLMVAGVGAVAAAGVWDAKSQAADALRQFTWDQHLLAVALSIQLRPAPAVPEPAAHDMVGSFLDAARKLEAEGNVVVLLHRPERRGFLLTDGRIFDNPALLTALDQGAPGTSLDRDAARQLGLPPRSAVAGLARLAWPGDEHAALAIVGSAGPERDRGIHGEWRTIITVTLVTLLILGVGAGALLRQRRELELSRQLAIRATEHQRDLELSRADRMAAIAALSSGIAHEISTPLGVISGRLEQLGASIDGAAERRLLDSISQQVERINKVIRGFLGLARGDAPILTHVPAGQVVRGAASLVQHRFATAGVTLDIPSSPVEPRLVACDPELFEQVLVNLLINALEASERGQQVQLCLTEAGGRIVFEVVDEGHGITRAAIAHATEPFFTTKAKKGGSGLGLAIAREIVAHHRGELRLERRADVDAASSTGTRASIFLPEGGP